LNPLRRDVEHAVGSIVCLPLRAAAANANNTISETSPTLVVSFFILHQFNGTQDAETAVVQPGNHARRATGFAAPSSAA
jgi:hypothetical protein